MAGLISNGDPFGYLHRTGVMSSGIAKGADRPKVKTVAIAVKRPPEYPSRTPAGPREGHPAGRVKGTGANRNAAPPKAAMDGDGWMDKKNTPSRMGPETGPSQGFETQGSNKAKAAGKKGVETQSPKVEMKKGLAKHANIEGNESPMYERLEKKSLKSLKGGGTEKELREGHNEKKWIAGAIKRPGAFTAKAKKAKMGVQEYAQKMKSAPGRTGKQARLAMTLKKMHK
jgi:hypothetical protein